MKSRINLIKLYLDTSVYGSIDNHRDGRSSHVMALFNEIQKRKEIRIYYSETILKELVFAPKKSRRIFKFLIETKKAKQLKINSKIYLLAEAYIARGVLTNKSYEDALHIAFASFYTMNLLLTYNMKHMGGFLQGKRYNEVNAEFNVSNLVIAKPGNVKF